MRYWKHAGVLFAAAAVLLWSASPLRAQQTTAFTYQGQLRDGTTNANGVYTMIFKLYDAVTNGTQIGVSITNSPTLANGLFTVNLDFGAGVFSGDSRWLDITITNGPDTQTLSPRVPITPAPYALYALNSGGGGSSSNGTITANTVTASNLVVQGGSDLWGFVTDSNGNLTLGYSSAVSEKGENFFPPWLVSIGWSFVKDLLNRYVFKIATDMIITGKADITGNLKAAAVESTGKFLGQTDAEIKGKLETIGKISSDSDITAGGDLILGESTSKIQFSDGSEQSTAAGIPRGIQLFITSGTFTVPTGVTRIMVEMWGGGGGGGGGYSDPTNTFDAGGGGGGSGGYGIQLFNVTPAANYSVTVGSGGTGGTGGSFPGSATAGSLGTSSSFGGILVANGGGGGGAATRSVNGTGGAKPSPGSGSLFPATIGNSGSFGGQPGPDGLTVGGRGASMFRGGDGGFGGLGRQGQFSGEDGNHQGSGGGGGAGGSEGGDGGNGMVIITY